MIVTLAELKAQLNQTLDADDSIIQGKGEAAQDYIERALGYKIEERYGNQEPHPPALKEAICLLAAHLYENREAVLVGVSGQSLPFGVWEIITEYRDYVF